MGTPVRSRLASSLLWDWDQTTNEGVSEEQIYQALDRIEDYFSEENALNEKDVEIAKIALNQLEVQSLSIQTKIKDIQKVLKTKSITNQDQRFTDLYQLFNRTSLNDPVVNWVMMGCHD